MTHRPCYGVPVCDPDDHDQPSLSPKFLRLGRETTLKGTSEMDKDVLLLTHILATDTTDDVRMV